MKETHVACQVVGDGLLPSILILLTHMEICFLPPEDTRSLLFYPFCYTTAPDSHCIIATLMVSFPPLQYHLFLLV